MAVTIQGERTRIQCRHCQSEAVLKFGKYKGTQLYRCKSCKRKFKADNSEFHIKKSDQAAGIECNAKDWQGSASSPRTEQQAETLAAAGEVSTSCDSPHARKTEAPYSEIAVVVYQGEVLTLCPGPSGIRQYPHWQVSTALPLDSPSATSRIAERLLPLLQAVRWAQSSCSQSMRSESPDGPPPTQDCCHEGTHQPPTDILPDADTASRVQSGECLMMGQMIGALEQLQLCPRGQV